MPDCRHLFYRRGNRSRRVLVCLRMRWRYGRILTLGECADCEHNTVPEALRDGGPSIKDHPAMQPRSQPSRAESDWLDRLGIGRESQ